MDRFLITGTMLKEPGKIFQLKLPEAKQYESVPDVVENDVNLNNVVRQAVKRGSYSWDNQARHVTLFGLNQIFLRHPFPRNQGPVILPFECEGSWQNGVKVNIRSPDEVMEQRTVFYHHDNQSCAVWYPVVTGVDSWKNICKGKGTYEVKELDWSIQGPSSLRDMSIVYTCNQYCCIIHCPCSICNDKRINCRMQCKTEKCHNCNSQCPDHALKLPRNFNAEVDHATLITQRIVQVQIGIPHAGIPLSCNLCSNDVLEHQSLHLVFHTRCRFCVHQMRAFNVLKRGVLSTDDFKKANKILNWSDARTCAYCLSKHKDCYARIKHEKQIHEGEQREFLCKQCDKSFTNQNALDYHEQKHEPVIEKETCNICGFQSSSKSTLNQHKSLIHNETCGGSSIFKCHYCEKTFNVKKSLNRHLRETHSHTSKNLDYIEDMDSAGELSCDQCEKRFRRKENLDRHISTVHVQKEMFPCLLCDKKFPRKDTLMKHLKKIHNS